MERCSGCGRLSMKKPYCSACGHIFDMIRFNAEYKVCPKCQEINAKDNRYCKNCECSFDESQNKESINDEKSLVVNSKGNESDAIRCPYCGSGLKVVGDAIVCNGCGSGFEVTFNVKDRPINQDPLKKIIPDDALRTIIDAFYPDRKIQAINAYKTKMNCSLKECTPIINAYFAAKDKMN